MTYCLSNSSHTLTSSFLTPMLPAPFLDNSNSNLYANTCGSAHNGRADSLSFIISPVCPYVSENFSPLQTSAGFRYHFYRIVVLLQCAGVDQNLSIVFVIILGIDMIVRLLADYEFPQTRGSFVFLFTDY